MSINWPKLVNQGRAKAIGVSWTEGEAVAISQCAPAEREALIVRLRGGTTVENKTLTGTGDTTLTPEEIKAQKDKEKADKKVAKEAEKAKAKADKEASKK